MNLGVTLLYFSRLDFAISKALLENTFFFSFSGLRVEGNSTTFVKIDEFNRQKDEEQTS